MSPLASGPARCTLVIPTFDAVATIDATVLRLRRFAADHADWRILFVCDGCRYVDPTTVRMIAHGWPMIGETLALRAELRRLGRRQAGARAAGREVGERTDG